MPTTYVVANRASNTLSAGLTANPTTIAVTDASAFPSPSAGQAAFVLVRAAADTTETGVYAVYQYTSRSGNTLSGVTYVAGTNGAGGGTWASSDVIAVRDVAEFVAKLSQIDANESVTGVKTFADGTSVQSGAERFTIQTTAPSDPPSTQMAAWARRISSGFPVPLFGVSDPLGSTSRDPFSHPMPSPVYDRWFWVVAASPSSVVSSGGLFTHSNSYTGPSVSAGSVRSETPRAGSRTTAANSAAGVATLTTSHRLLWRGNATGRGGFELYARFGLESITGNMRLLCGVTDDVVTNLVVDNGNPSARTAASTIAIIADQADTDITIGTCNGTTFTKTALTTGRTKTTAANQLFDLTIACAPNSASMRVRLLELPASGYGAPTVLYDGDISTTLPLNTAFMRPVFSISGGTTNESNALTIANAFGHWKAP